MTTVATSRTVKPRAWALWAGTAEPLKDRVDDDGSYARGGWVDEPHTAKDYQSDLLLRFAGKVSV